LLLLFFFGFFSGNSYSQKQGNEIIVLESQIVNEYFEVFITSTAIYDTMYPKLYLLNPVIEKGNSSKPTKANRFYEPSYIIRDYIMTVKIDSTDKEKQKIGSLLFFDVSDLNIPKYIPGVTVKPIINYTDHIKSKDTSGIKVERKDISITTDKNILIGNRFGARFWTFISFVAFFLFLFLLTKNDGKPILGLACTKENTLSMSLMQLAIWTIVVGFMVLTFGLIQHKIPHIPNSVLVLLSASAVTGVLGHIQSNKYLKTSQKIIGKTSNNNGGNNGDKEVYDYYDYKLKWRINLKKFSGLLQTMFYFPDSSQYSRRNNEPSLAKAQIFFWTLVTIILFIVKSNREGELWDIPDQFIALMGLSQITFLVRKQQGVMELDKEYTELKETNGNDTAEKPDNNKKESTQTNKKNTKNKK